MIAKPMTADEFALVRELFHRGCDLPASERSAFLDRSCHGNDSVRSAVESLFQADLTGSAGLQAASGELARQLLSPAEPPPPLQEIGPYQIVRILGEGGMGIAYLARQDEPKRDVALKILRAGAASVAARARFAREIQVLGRLEHPGIARIYEAGTAQTPRGPLSYFAMEFVDGPRLTRFADDHALGTADRLRLVVQIADAVQHAHSRGVIHRDLKPGNILVRQTPAGAAPVVLDFGVARLLDAESPHTALTESGSILGTVEYMSPEQLAGDERAVDARTDVYSMGVLLYELLAGKTPFNLKSKPLPEAARIVHEQEPPSLSSPSRRCDRDLRTIVAKAMAKDRDRRYTTAAALADDLRRYLAHETILARPATLAYQLSRVARRHRALVAVSIAGLLALVAGLIVSSTLYFREQRAHARAEHNQRLSTAVREYLIDGLLMSASPERMGYDAKVLDVLSKAADGLHERFADQPETEASVRSDLADALGKIGKLEESAAQWELAIPLLESCFGEDSPQAISALINKSRVYQQMKSQPRSHPPAAEALKRARRSLPDGDPLLVQALDRLGGWNTAEGRFKPAEEYLNEGLQLARADPERNQAVMVSLLTWLSECEGKRGRTQECLKLRREIVDQAILAFGAQSPAAIVARQNLIAALLSAKLTDEAVEQARTLPGAADAVFPPAHIRRAYIYRECGEAFRAAEQFDQAETLLKRADEAFVKAFGPLNPENEVTLDCLCPLYAGWPGHAEQFQETALRSIAVRLARIPQGRFFVIRNKIQKLSESGAAIGLDLTPAQWAQAALSRCDSYTPEGHPLRAHFMLNYARYCSFLGLSEEMTRALDSAEAALPYASGSRQITNMIQSLRAGAPELPESAPPP